MNQTNPSEKDSQGQESATPAVWNQFKTMLYITRDCWYVLGAIGLIYLIAWIVF